MTDTQRVRRRRGTVAPWLGVWLVVAATVVLAHMLTFTKLSQIDEYQHVDYLDKTLHLEFVNGGEKVGDLAMREQACRKMDLPGFTLPECDAETLTPEQFPGLGYNHTYADPPTYYAITGPVAKAVQTVTGLDSVVTAARGVGILWLGAGLLVTFLLARRLGADDWSAAGATLMLAGTPVVLEASSTVTTDAPELLVGGLLTLLAVAVVQRRASPWWLALGAAGAMAFKTTSLSVVGMVALFLLVHAVRARRGTAVAAETAAPTHRHAAERGEPVRSEAGRTSGAFLPFVLVLVCGAVPLLAWTALTRATAYDSVEDIPVANMFKVDSIGWSQLSTSVKYLFTPVNESYSPAFMHTDSINLAVVVLNVLLIVGTLGLGWLGTRDELATSLAGSVFTCMVLGGPALTLMLFFTEHVSYSIPGRYGLSLLPAATASLAVAASRRRYGGPALVVLGVLVVLAFLVACG